MSYAEIVQLISIAESAAQNRWAGLRRRLQKHLGDDMPEWIDRS